MYDWYIVYGNMVAYHAYSPKRLYKTCVMVYAHDEKDAIVRAVLRRNGFGFEPENAKRVDENCKYVVSEEFFVGDANDDKRTGGKCFVRFD